MNKETMSKINTTTWTQRTPVMRLGTHGPSANPFHMSVTLCDAVAKGGIAVVGARRPFLRTKRLLAHVTTSQQLTVLLMPLTGLATVQVATNPSHTPIAARTPKQSPLQHTLEICPQACYPGFHKGDHERRVSCGMIPWW